MGAGGKLLTADVCRRKADEYLRAADASTDPQSQEGFRRTAEAWMSLALHAEQHPLSPPPIRQLGDALRERLHLTEADDPDLPDPK